MPLRKIEGTVDVLTAAKQRVRNAFRNGCKVYLSFSSGKDSLCMSSITYDLIRAGEINPMQLTVVFIDEEGLYPSMVEAAHRWRRNFLSVGAEFLWLCLPFKQVSVIDHLSMTESWITWEPGKEDVWMRQPPPFAIRHSPILECGAAPDSQNQPPAVSLRADLQIRRICSLPGEMNYQTFCRAAFSDGIQMVGLRTSESLTRLNAVAHMDASRPGACFYPIYDWKDSDVWRYILERGLEFPEIYMRLYEAGVKKNALRLCAFFGDCGTQGLRWIAETDPDLWARIERREPNAYLVLLYWDSEMFRRTTRKRSELEGVADDRDYRALVEDVLFLHTDRYMIPPDTARNLKHWRTLYKKTYGIARNHHYKRIYEALLYGDPKNRVLRIMWNNIFLDYKAEVSEHG